MTSASDFLRLARPATSALPACLVLSTWLTCAAAFAQSNVASFACSLGSLGPYKISVNLENGAAIDGNEGHGYQMLKYTDDAIWLFRILPRDEEQAVIMTIGWNGPEDLFSEGGEWSETAMAADGSATQLRHGTCSRTP